MSFNDLTQLIGYVAAVLTTASFLPQALHTFKTKDVSGISLGMYSVFVFGVALWLVYGFMLGEWPLIVANTITITLAGFILWMKLRYVNVPGASAAPPATPPAKPKKRHKRN